MRTSNFRISTRIGTGLFVVAGFSLVLGLLAMLQMSKVAQATEHIAEANLPRVQLSAELRDGLNDLRRAEEAAAGWERAKATFETARLWVTGTALAAFVAAAALAVLITGPSRGRWWCPSRRLVRRLARSPRAT